MDDYSNKVKSIIFIVGGMRGYTRTTLQKDGDNIHGNVYCYGGYDFNRDEELVDIFSVFEKLLG